MLQQFNETVKTCQEQKALITQLEDDLRKVNALSVMFRGDAEVSNREQLPLRFVC